MKALISGGAGFLGSHLCDRLLEFDYEIVCVDNLITGKKENIAHLLDNPKFQFVEADVTTKLADFGKIDQIYHLASPASPNIHNPKSYHALPFETMLANTTGTWNLCQLAVDNHAKFLFASTSECYGDPLEHPQKETYRGNVSTIGPRSVYDEAKRFGETITEAFVRSKGLDGRIVRIFNTYGPRMADDGRVVISFLKSAMRNEPITLYGNGVQTRSFCYVTDLIEGLLAAQNAHLTKGEVYNLGNHVEFSVKNLAEMIKRVTGSESVITATDALPEDDPMRRQPDTEKAKKNLDWQVSINLEDGLKKLFEYLKTHPLS